MLRDLLLRPARVIVNRSAPTEDPQDTDGTLQ